MSNFAKRPQHGPLNLAHQIAWEKQYQQLLLQFLTTHEEFDGSAVAAWMRKQGLHDPDHHNLWGTQITYYAKLGWMVPVGRGIPSGAAHIAQVRIWRSAFYKAAKIKKTKGQAVSGEYNRFHTHQEFAVQACSIHGKRFWTENTGCRECEAAPEERHNGAGCYDSDTDFFLEE